MSPQDSPTAPILNLPNETAAQPARERPVLPSTAPLALWLFLQLGILVLAATRLPLAAQYPEPAERMAVHLVFGTQVAAAALLFPFLLRDVRAAVQVIATAVPFQLAAGSLAGMSPSALVWPAAHVAAWLATLALYSSFLPGLRSRTVGMTAASILTLGGGALRYLGLEFAPGSGGAHVRLENVSPLLSTLAALDGTSSNGWILTVLLAAGPIAWMPLKRFYRRTPASTSAPRVA